MLKKSILLVLYWMITGSCATAQSTRFIVTFKNKGANPFSISNPSAYLSNRAIQRRQRYNLAVDSSDLPITPRYIDSVRLSGNVTILNSSKWLNQVAIQTTDAAALVKINSFSFVAGTNAIAAKPVSVHAVSKKLDTIIAPAGPSPQSPLGDYFSYGQSYGQVHIHNGEFLHNRGFRGQGMQLALLDAGFYNYLTLPTFDSVRNNNQILGTWDFVANEASVNEDHPHGMECFSTIAANMPGTFTGTAPKTSFYLYRTEDAATEYPIEEQNWAAAAERADSLGVDVISTSLGYSTFDDPSFNHTYADMNGNTTIAAKAADFAAKKGMIVVVAAGNEGTSSWHYITTPADADSVMAVGAVSTAGAVASFSSYGPSSDGQVKPAVAAVGLNAVIANPSTGQPAFGSGTSFACPNMAGLTTCLWQAFPEVNNITVINTLQQAATRANNPDNRVGYGIPDVKKAFVMLINQLHTQQAVVARCKTTLQWNVKTDSAFVLTVERKLVTDNNYVPISVTAGSGAFAARSFTYDDDLTSITSTTIKYRLRVDISTDTSFYLDSAMVSFTPRPNLGSDQSVTRCSDSSINLTTYFNTTGLTTAWSLSGAAVSNPAAVNASGNYQLIATNISGCADTALVMATVIPKPNLGADRAVSKCTDSSYNLQSLYTTTGLTANWTLNGSAVSTPQAATAAGSYRLVAFNSSGCSDTALVMLSNDPQLCPAVIENISISPNPVTDYVTVIITRKNTVDAKIVIHNTAGQEMYRKSNPQQAGTSNYPINMKWMPAGVYFVSVWVNGERVKVKKVVKR
ncbi:MAG: S8 family peptidase [Bacteroidetes bacterium]|nr:S8 family peptidase [Bacteroidota bacterium]